MLKNLLIIIKTNLYYSINFTITSLVVFIHTNIIKYIILYKCFYKWVSIDKVIIKNFIMLNINFIFVKISILKYYFLCWSKKIQYKWLYLGIIIIHLTQVLKHNLLSNVNKILKLFKFSNILSPYRVYSVRWNIYTNINMFKTLVFYLIFSFQIFFGTTILFLSLIFIVAVGGVTLIQFIENVFNGFAYVLFAAAKFFIHFFLFFSNFFFEKTLVLTTFSTRLVAFSLITGVIAEYFGLILAFLDYIRALAGLTHFLLLTPLEFLDDAWICNWEWSEFCECMLKFPPVVSWFDFLLHNLTGVVLINVLCLSVVQTILTYYLIFFDGGVLCFSFLNFFSFVEVIADALEVATACEFFRFFNWWSLIGGEFVLRGIVPIFEATGYLVPNVGGLGALSGAFFLPLTGLLTTLLVDLVCAVGGVINFVTIWYFFVFSYSLVFDAGFYFFISSFGWFVGVGVYAILGAGFSLLYSGVDCLLRLVAWFMLELSPAFYFGLVLDFFMVFSYFSSFSSLVFFKLLFIFSNLSDFYVGALSFDPGAVAIYYYVFTFLVVVIISGIGKLSVLTIFRGISGLCAPACDGVVELGRSFCLEAPLHDLENRLFVGGDSKWAGSRYRLCVRRRSLVTRFLVLVNQPVYVIFYWAWGGLCYKRVCLVRKFVSEFLYAENRSSFYRAVGGCLRSCVNLLFAKTIWFADTFGQLGTYMHLVLFPGRRSFGAGLTTNRAIFVRINVISSLPFFLLACFTDNFLWMGAYRGGGEQACVTNSFLVTEPAAVTNLTMNSRFMRELGMTQLRFSERAGWGANSFVARYFKVVDEFGLSQLSTVNLQYTHPTIFLSSISELSLLNVQFVAHNTFISVFFGGFSFVPLTGRLGSEIVDDLSDVSWFYAVVSSVYRFVGGWSSDNFLIPAVTVFFTPLSLVVAQFIDFVFDFLEVDSAFGWGELDMPELWKLQNSVYSLQNLISGVTFASEETLLLATQRASNNPTLKANAFAAWRWLYLIRAQYRLFGGVYAFPRILGGDLPRQIYYSPNPYYSFELVPEFFYPLSVFLDSPSLGANFGVPLNRARLTSSRVGEGCGEVALSSLWAFSLKSSGRVAPRQLSLTGSLNFSEPFKLSEVKYRRLYSEFRGTSVFRRYNYYFSELSGVDSLQNELYSVGRWSTDFLLYDKFAKHFASNYWGKKQALSLQFLEYNKYQYFKKLKIEFLGSNFGYLGSLKRKIGASRDSTFSYLDSLRRDRLIQQVAFFFFTVYDEFLNSTSLDRASQFLTGSFVVDELLSCGFMHNGWLLIPLLYSGELVYFLEFNCLHFFLKLCSFFSHVGVLPYLPLATLIGTHVAEFTKFGGLSWDSGVDSQIFHLYVARANVVLFTNKGINLKLGGLYISGTYTKI